MRPRKVKNTACHLCLLLPRKGAHKTLPWQAPEDGVVRGGGVPGREGERAPQNGWSPPAHFAEEKKGLRACFVELLKEVGD